MYSKLILVGIALSVLIPFFYERANLIWTFYANAPVRLSKLNALGSYEIKFADKIRSCEDALFIEEHHVAIIACDAGRERWNTVMGVFVPGEVESANLWVYDYMTDAETSANTEVLRRLDLVGFPSENDFHTLGLAYDKASSILLVTNHAKAGSRIEMFKVDLDALTATYIRTIKHSLIHAPNSIALISDKEFYVTNDHYITKRVSKIGSLLETYLGTPTGTVVHVVLEDSDINAKVIARVAFANGIEMLNSSTLAVASSTRAAVFLFYISEQNTAELISKIDLPFLPDNLSLSGGKLLIAGHPHFPALVKFTQTRHICNDPKELEKATPDMQDYCATGEATSWVAEWSEKGGLKHLYVDTEYPTSATASRDAERGVGIISGLYAKGILVWKDA